MRIAMIKEIIQAELRLTDGQMRRLRLAASAAELFIFLFIWYMLFTTNPLASCARQFFVNLGGYGA